MDGISVQEMAGVVGVFGSGVKAEGCAKSPAPTVAVSKSDGWVVVWVFFLFFSLPYLPLRNMGSDQNQLHSGKLT